MEKYLKDIQVGDRISYFASDLEHGSENYTSMSTPLSGDVLRKVDLGSGFIKIATASGWLLPYPDDTKFDLVGDDFDRTASQVQCDPTVNQEKCCGVSIE